VLSVSIIHLSKLDTPVRLIGRDEVFKKTNFTHVFLFLMYDVCVTPVSALIKKLCSLIKESYACVLKSFTTHSDF
jgi:hypothetical protein